MRKRVHGFNDPTVFDWRLAWAAFDAKIKQSSPTAILPGPCATSAKRRQSSVPERSQPDVPQRAVLVIAMAVVPPAGEAIRCLHSKLVNMQ
jgi:hypothetical protein